ncbi:MAG: HigA family addiction module antitoxin [Thermodesulfobacteriota bacterium]
MSNIERKRPPVHPGRIIRKHYLEPLSISITDLADKLGVSRKTVSKIVNERGAVTADMAGRLSKVFSTTPDLWMNLQKNYDLWKAADQSNGWPGVKPVEVWAAGKNELPPGLGGPAADVDRRMS